MSGSDTHSRRGFLGALVGFAAGGLRFWRRAPRATATSERTCIFNPKYAGLFRTIPHLRFLTRQEEIDVMAAGYRVEYLARLSELMRSHPKEYAEREERWKRLGLGHA